MRRDPESELIDEVLQWSAEKIYDVFGPFLEYVVDNEKAKLQSKLKTIWKSRRWYAFRDTGEQFDADTMQIYFSVKKLKTYSLHELEQIIDKIETETNYSNPKACKHQSFCDAGGVISCRDCGEELAGW